jgi:hypothetical protein
VSRTRQRRVDLSKHRWRKRRPGQPTSRYLRVTLGHSCREGSVESLKRKVCEAVVRYVYAYFGKLSSLPQLIEIDDKAVRAFAIPSRSGGQTRTSGSGSFIRRTSLAGMIPRLEAAELSSCASWLIERRSWPWLLAPQMVLARDFTGVGAIRPVVVCWPVSPPGRVDASSSLSTTLSKASHSAVFPSS